MLTSVFAAPAGAVRRLRSSLSPLEGIVSRFGVHH